MHTGALSPGEIYKPDNQDVRESLIWAERDLELAATLAMEAVHRLLTDEPKTAAGMAGRAMDIHNRAAKLVGAKPFDPTK